MAGAWDSLCALLALQLRDLSRADLLEAYEGISQDNPVSLPTRLVNAGLLTSEEAELVRRMAEAAIEAHRGNAEAALNTLGGEEALWNTLDPARTLSAASGRTTTPMRETPFRFSETAPIDPLEEIPGRYAETSEYGRGGMGRILLAHDVKMGRDIALKELLPVSESSPLFPEKSPVRYTAAIAARFLQEGRITAGLEHPSIVPVYEIGRRPSGNLYYTMKLVRGQSLARALRTCKTLDERLSLLPHVIDLCEAMAYAHSRGVLHRDIKPSNVMLGAFGETVVLDWGVAKVKSQAEDPYEQDIRNVPKHFVTGENTPLPQTRPGQAIGTPEYMSPEQAQGLAEQIDERSDLYALGVVLYELLTGTTPFRAPSASETMRRVVLEETLPVLEKEPDAPAELVSICEKALQKDPAARYQSVREFADEIKRFQTGALVQTYRYSLWQLVSRYYKKHRSVLNVIAAASGILLCLAVLSYLQIYQARNREYAQRLLAEEARDTAIVAEDKAEEAKEEAEHSAYVAQIRLLHAYVRDRNFARANTLVWSISEKRRNWEWGYLLEQCNQDLFTLREHKALVFRAMYDHAGKHILTLGGDRSARIWNAVNGAALVAIKTPYALINDGEFSPDDQSVLLALWDGTARVFDAATGKETLVLEGHTASVQSACFEQNGNRIVTGSNDGTVRFWDAHTGKELESIKAHEKEVIGAYPSPDGQTLLTSSYDKQIRLWRKGETYELVQTIPGEFPVYSASGARFCFVDNGAAAVWDVEGGRRILRTDQGSAKVLRARFSPDEKLLLATTTGGVARLYDVDSGAVKKSFNHGEAVKDGQFSTDQSLLLLLSDAGLVTVWDLATQDLVNSFVGHEAGVGRAVFSPDGQRIATASRDGTAKIWDTRRSLTKRVQLEQSAPIDDVVVSWNGNRIAIVARNNTVTEYDSSSIFPEIAHWCFSHFGPGSAALNTDGSVLASPLDGSTVFVWDTGANEVISLYAGHRGRVSAIAFSPKSNVVVTGGREGIARVWEARTGTETLTLEGHTGRLHCAAFSPDGTVIATGAHDKTVRVWDAETGAARHVLDKHRGAINHVAFSPDGLFLVSGSNDGSVICWAVDSGEALYKLIGHAGPVASARFSGDGARILTASWDESVRIWEAGTGKELLTLSGTDYPLLDAEFLKDSRSVLVAGWDGRATAHFAAPWRMEQLDGTPGATLKERYEAAKHERLRQRWPEHKGSIVPPAIVHITREHAREQLGRLLTLLDESVDTASAGPGMEISAGPMADAVKRLCLLPGDRITSINDSSVDGVPSARALIAAFIEDQAGTPPLQLEIVRKSSPIHVRYAFHPRLDIEHSATLSRETARASVEYLAEVLMVGIEQLVRVNQDMNSRLGEGVASREILNGLWVPPETGAHGAPTLEALGIAVGDRILTVNGIEIKALSQLDEFLQAARSALKKDKPITLTSTIERGEFQEIHLTINVP
ncbi:MAG: protein kinase [Candidatus Hydrogenedentota bacterium]